MAQIESMLIIIGYSALFLIVYLILAFIIGTIKKNNGLMDVFYGPGYIIVAISSLILYLIIDKELDIRKLFITSLVSIWAVRLGIYIFIRNRGKPEDYRYQAMRKRWVNNIILKSFVRIYMIQGLVIFIVAFPVWFVNISDVPIIKNLLDFTGITIWFGTLIWLIGFYFESLGDYQLYKFKRDPINKGEVMDQGLWKYTQHPNYFGEVIQWWGIYIIALAVPFGFISIIGPIFITYLIIKVSGIRLLNYRYRNDDKYTKYKKRTSAFFPWIPKKQKEN